MPRTWTAEQRKAASEKFKARMAARNAEASPVADVEPAVEVPAEVASEDLLAQLSGLFAQASSQKQGRDKAVTDALEILGNLDPTKYPEIANNPTVEQFVERVQSARMKSADVPPGTIFGRGIAAQKQPWSWLHLKKGMGLSREEVERRAQAGEIIFPWVEYVPVKTTEVIWNGLKVYFKARQRVYVCKVFVDVFEESLNQEEFAEQHAAWLFKSPEAQRHQDMLTPGAARIRAMDEGRGEYYHPGGGMIALVPSADLAALSGGEGDAEE